MLYWIMDVNDMYYMDRTHVHACTYVHTDKLSIEHTSVGVIHACPINVVEFN